LRDGRRVEIRALRPQDRDAITAVISRAGARSLFLRFFAVRRSFTEREIDFFMNVDFSTHVALVAVTVEHETPAIVGGGRYVCVAPGKAEVAFMVVDEYHGQGIGSALLKHLAIIARSARIQEFVADVLAENTAMLNVFRRFAPAMATSLEGEVTHVSIRL
jgi:RimJ/RimL family protein N-acetyltransferase